MSNFTIEFVYPWVLLILIPAIGLSLFPYLRTPKKYRRTRNRITSLVLHIAVLTLSVFALSGITFSYDVVNDQNELILLVDASFSMRDSDQKVNEFVRSVLEESDDMNKVGVVTFGYDQVYAVKLTNDTEKAYRQYLDSEMPDSSATDISAALNYARGLFTRPESGKIVLISDGVETDGDAVNSIKSIAADGIKVDTVYFESIFNDKEVQIKSVTLPDYNISIYDDFEISITLHGNNSGTADVRIYDNDEPIDLSGDGSAVYTRTVSVYNGDCTSTFTHAFESRGLHRLDFVISTEDDAVAENNVYHSYYYIETFDNILVIASDTSETGAIKELLEEEDYTVTVIDINNEAYMPTTIAELREYDEVLLFNIANADLPEGFIEILHSYVSDLGGGLFTIGGDKIDVSTGEKTANAYNRKDLYGTLYQDMLPVQAIEYTPPLGLMIIVDHSGSMFDRDTYNGSTRLEAAKDGAVAALYALQDRDWCGIMALDDMYSVEQALVPATQQNMLRNTINAIEIGGGTTYSNAIAYAGRALSTLSVVEKRHILLISDGEPGDRISDYGPIIEQLYNEHDITFSMIVVKSSDLGSYQSDLQEAVRLGGGSLHHITSSNSSMSVADAVRADLTMSAINEYQAEPFTPTLRDFTSVVHGLTAAEWPMLGGFYGTKLKDGAEAPLYGPYVPIYAQWQYGRGHVGSFMSELSGTSGSWSYEFLHDDTGRQFIKNVINALFPSQSIKYSDLDVGMDEDNYTTNLSIYTTMNDDESIRVSYKGPYTSDDGEQLAETTYVRTVAEGYSRMPIVTTEGGVYEILVSKLDANGYVLTEYRAFKAFAYSKEYDMEIDTEAAFALMMLISETGRGAMVEEPLEVFRNFTEKLHKTIDPRIALLIIVLVLFLLDIAVRKFKWKWLHELVKEHKEKKNQQGE